MNQRHTTPSADTTRTGTPAGHGGVPGAASARRRCNPTVFTTDEAGPSGPIAVSESWAPAARIWRPAHAATPATLSPTGPRSAAEIDQEVHHVGGRAFDLACHELARARRHRPRDSTKRIAGTYSRTLRVMSPSPAATTGPVGKGPVRGARSIGSLRRDRARPDPQRASQVDQPRARSSRGGRAVPTSTPRSRHAWRRRGSSRRRGGTRRPVEAP